MNPSTMGILNDVVIEIKEAISNVERAREKETDAFKAMIATMEELAREYQTFTREYQTFIKRLEALK